MITIPGLPSTHGAYASASLVELRRPDGTEYRYTDAAANITYSGVGGQGLPDPSDVFFSEPLRVKGVYRGGGQAVGIVEFDDINDVVKSLARLYEMVDWTARIWRVGIDADFAITWIKWECEGLIVEVDDSLAATRIEIDSRSLTGDSERYQLSCPFVFGGARCGFAGDTSAGCDHTFSGGCTTYANTPRFGGFRNLPSPGKQLPQWGGVTVRYE